MVTIADESNDEKPLAAPLCIHCGLEVPRGLLGEGFNTKNPDKLFCCSGCAFVYEALHGHGLEEFYAIRERIGISKGVRAQARKTGYEFMDGASFSERYVTSEAGGLNRIALYLSGVHCAACVWVVERLPRILNGVVSAQLNLAQSRVDIRYDAERVSLSRIAATLNDIGYPPHPLDSDAESLRRSEAEKRMLLRIGVAGLAAGNVMLFAVSLYEGAWSGIAPEYHGLLRWASLLVALPAAAYSAFPFYYSAFKGLRVGVLHLDLPIALGILGGFGLSAYHTISGAGEVYYDSVCMLIFLLLIGRLLQQRAVNRSLAKLDSLPGFLPASALRRNSDNSIEEVYARELLPGDVVVLSDGWTAAADSRVCTGSALCSFAVLTGESRPKRVGPGDELPAGAQVVSGSIDVELTSTSEGSRIAGALNSVRETAAESAPLQALTDRIGTVFVGAVALLGSSTFWWWSAEGIDAALNATLALIVISCPCALALAVPLTMSIALSRAASSGILVQGASVLERLTGITKVFFDKTGTLTLGEPKVQQAFLSNNGEELLPWASVRGERRRSFAAAVRALESESSHPVANALRDFLKDIPAESKTLDIEHQPGLGVKGKGDKYWVIGSAGMLSANGIDCPRHFARASDEMERAQISPVFLAVEGSVAALFGIADSLRADAAKTVSFFTERGVKVGVLSGDRSSIVKQCAEELGISPRHAVGEVLPEEKRGAISEESGSVCMVGDGMNDAQALLAADIGIGIRGGAESCLKNADVFIASGRTGDIPAVFLGAERTIGVIKGSLYFSLAYNLVGAVLAVSGLVGPLGAAVAMPLSSLTVVAMSSLRRTF